MSTSSSGAVELVTKLRKDSAGNSNLKLPSIGCVPREVLEWFPCLFKSLFSTPSSPMSATLRATTRSPRPPHEPGTQTDSVGFYEFASSLCRSALAASFWLNRYGLTSTVKTRPLCYAVYVFPFKVRNSAIVWGFSVTVDKENTELVTVCKTIVATRLTLQYGLFEQRFGLRQGFPHQNKTSIFRCLNPNLFSCKGGWKGPVSCLFHIRKEII